MTRPIDIEHELDRWFSDGPDEVADRVIDAALADIDLTSQRSAGIGRPWRTSTMKRSMPMMAAAAFVVFVGAVALSYLLVTSPKAASPSTAPSTDRPDVSPAATISTEGWTTFVSTRWGYTIGVPAGWTPRFNARGDVVEDPALDWFASSDPNVAFAVRSWPIDTGTTLDGWIESYNPVSLRSDTSWGPRCSVPAGGWQPIVVAGLPGLIHGGSPDCSYTEAAAITGDRVYVFSGFAKGGDIDRSTFDTFVGSARLDPTAIVVPPSPPPPPTPTPGPSPNPAVALADDAQAMEALMPTTLCDKPATVTTLDPTRIQLAIPPGHPFHYRYDFATMVTDTLIETGRSPGDAIVVLDEVTGPSACSDLGVFRLKGADPIEFESAVLKSPRSAPYGVSRSLAGRQVHVATFQGPGGGTSNTYLYFTGDAVFFFTARDDAWAKHVLRTLP